MNHAWQQKFRPDDAIRALVPDWFLAAYRAGADEKELRAQVRAFCVRAQERRAYKNGGPAPTTPPDPHWVEHMLTMFLDTVTS